MRITCLIVRWCLDIQNVQWLREILCCFMLCSLSIQWHVHVLLNRLCGLKIKWKIFLEDSWENEKFSILIFFVINVHQLHVPLKYFLVLVVDCPRILSWCGFLSKVFLSFSETVLFVLPIWSKKKGKQSMKFKQLSWNIKQYGKGRER